MKKLYSLLACGSALLATGTVAALTLPQFSMSEVNLHPGEAQAITAEISRGVPASRIVKHEAPRKESADEAVPACVKVESMISEDFHLWEKGTNQIPDSERIVDDENFLHTMMSVPDQDWILFDVYQAGQAAYLGFDEVGDDGPGYISTPVVDVTGDNVAYRLRVTAMNVNPDAQEQNLQNFFLDEEQSIFAGASAQPLLYNEWSTVEWIGKTDCKKLRAMVMGWRGKVLINNIEFDKLIYPLASPKVTDVEMKDIDQVKVTWNAVEGATSYVVEVTKDGESMGISTVGDVTETVVTTTVEPEVTYLVKVTAYNGEDCSYPGFKGTELQPQSVGSTVALEATDVTENGFTANWEAAQSAAQYLVYPTVNHTATADGETFFLLQDYFANVPEANDAYNPALICPMLGMGGDLNRYMGCYGWSSDFCIFMRLMPEMPALVLTNMYAMYGLPGYIMSPSYDLSVGGGKVKISGMGMSSEDDVVLTASLVDSKTMQPYSSEEIEVTPRGDAFEVTLENGRPDSSIMLVITDAAGEDMVLVPYLTISVDLNEGESIIAPLPTVVTPDASTSYSFECPVNDCNLYSYRVQGFFGNVMGLASDPVAVNVDTKVGEVADNGAKVAVEGSDVVILNPAGVQVYAYSADGRVVAASSDAEIRVSGYKGLLLVRIGEKTFKVVR